MKTILFRALLCIAAMLLYARPACAQHSLTFSVDQPESPLTVDAAVTRPQISSKRTSTTMAIQYAVTQIR